MNWLTDPVMPPDADRLEQARRHQDRLTKPRGSLGELETLGALLAAVQNRPRPRLDRVRIVVFAADHGIAAGGISAYPQAVTGEMVRNFARGGAAINVLARQWGADLEVVNLGTVNPLEWWTLPWAPVPPVSWTGRPCLTSNGTRPWRSDNWPWNGGRSAALFPGAGLVIGLLLVAVHWLIPEGRPGVEAALLLCVWALATGGLHLDGLADAADAWVGGYGNRERTLEIMKDPRAGPVAVMVVGLVLILKFAALQALLEAGHWLPLLLVPVLGRGAILTMLLTTAYIRPEGIGVAHADHLPRTFTRRLVIALALLTWLVWGGAGLILLALLGLGGWGLRRILLERLGGTTGDTLGATCELAEAVALTVLALTLAP